MKGPFPNGFLKRIAPADRKPMGKAGMTHDECIAAGEVEEEREIQSQIVSWLRRNEIEFINPPMHKRSQLPVGAPDFHFAIKGKAVAVEVKTQSGQLDPDQNRRINKMRSGLNQWHIRVVRSYPEFVKFMEELIK